MMEEVRVIGIYERIAKASKVLLNSHPNEVYEVGLDDRKDHYRKCDKVDLYEATPSRVRNTVKNRRFASVHDSQAQGILMDLMTKTNTKWHIAGDNDKAVKHLEEMSEVWDLDNIIDNILWKGFVDGDVFQHLRIVENHIKPTFLAYDGVDYRIKVIFDEDGDVCGYKQVIQKNARTNKGWLRKKFDELEEDLTEMEISYELDEIQHMKYLERDGKANALIGGALEPIYYKRVLREQMPLTVYKNSNIISVTMGNENKMNTYLDKDARDEVAEVVNNYHMKGCLILPYGIEVELLKGGSLPQIQDYIKYFEKEVYIALNTPEAVFSSESSNRATADIQLDSKTTGRVLFLEYNRDWVAKYIKKLFDKELELQNIKGECHLEFEMDDYEEAQLLDEETDPNSLHKPIVKKGQEDLDRNGRTSIVKNPSSSTNVNHDVPNITRNQQRYQGR